MNQIQLFFVRFLSMKDDKLSIPKGVSISIVHMSLEYFFLPKSMRH